MPLNTMSSTLQTRFQTLFRGATTARFTAGTTEVRTRASAELAHKLAALGITDLSAEGIAPLSGVIRVVPGLRRGLRGVPAQPHSLDGANAPSLHTWCLYANALPDLAAGSRVRGTRGAMWGLVSSCARTGRGR